MQGNASGARKHAREWSSLFPGRYYLEVQRASRPDDEALVASTVDLAGETGLPVVATHPVQYLRRDDFRAHEARVCIAEGHLLADPRRPRPFTTEQHLATTAEMAAKFADIPEALANTVTVAKRCNLAIALGKPHLPDFPLPEGVTIDEHLGVESRAGLLPGASPRSTRTPRSASAAARSTSPGWSSRRGPSCRWASPATS